MSSEVKLVSMARTDGACRKRLEQGTTADHPHVENISSVCNNVESVLRAYYCNTTEALDANVWQFTHTCLGCGALLTTEVLS